MTWRWNHFEPKEVLSPEGLNHLNRGNLKIHGFFLDMLNDYRDFVDLPLYANHKSKRTKSVLTLRGYRTNKENKKAKGVPDSPHPQGIAADLSCYDLDMATFIMKAVRYNHEKYGGFTGIGIYPNAFFIHHDARTMMSGGKVFWNGENRRSIFLEDKVLAGSDNSVFFALQKTLRLPKKWRLKND